MIKRSVQVIIAAYNAEQTIGKTVEAIIDQSFKDWSLFVVDDASTDQTKRLIERYALLDRRVVPLSTGKNSGVSAARNLGLSLASTTAYTAYCDADDVWLPTHLESSLITLEKGADLVYCNPIWINEKNERLFPTFPVFSSYDRERLKKGNFIWISTVVHKGIIGLFDTDFAALADYDMWIRAAKQGLLFKQKLDSTCMYLIREQGMAKEGNSELPPLKNKHLDFLE